ncbi:MAG: polysaccharide biosynthesis/export family protein [Acidobacteriota bacterium]
MRFKAEYALVLAGLLLLTVASRAQTLAPSSPTPEATGAAPDQVTPPVTTRAHNTTYLIGDDDVLDINVWKEPELSKQVPVRSDGKISLPLVGELQAAGKTPVQLEDDITTKLRNFITEPAVTVMVTKINSLKFNVMGEVIKPGSYSLTTTTTVVDAIATAGGFRDFAKKKSIYVLRSNADGTEARLSFNYNDFVKGKNSKQNVHLLPGDTVVVP